MRNDETYLLKDFGIPFIGGSALIGAIALAAYSAAPAAAAFAAATSTAAASAAAGKVAGAVVFGLIFGAVGGGAAASVAVWPATIALFILKKAYDALSSKKSNATNEVSTGETLSRSAQRGN